ncbi:MAG: SDR family NAD(P)-dependent oxidoreductase [Dehalococcoidia bacterium]
MSDQTLAGKRVLVLGGETALGRAIAVGLAERGADVAIASLTRDTKAEFAINSALNELWAMNRKGVALAIDASDGGQLRDAVARAEGELGALDLGVAVEGDVALDGLEGREMMEVVVVAADGDAGEAVREVVDRLVGDGRGQS